MTYAHFSVKLPLLCFEPDYRIRKCNEMQWNEKLKVSRNSMQIISLSSLRVHGGGGVRTYVRTRRMSATFGSTPKFRNSDRFESDAIAEVRVSNSTRLFLCSAKRFDSVDLWQQISAGQRAAVDANREPLLYQG